MSQTFTQNPKFLHVAFHIHEALFRAPILIGGFYNWHMAFKGDFSLYPAKKGKLEEYDIVFVGLSRPELEGCLLSQMRKELGPNSKTKIVACIDYAIELWQGTFNPFNLEQELMQCDMVFISEPAMISHVRSVVNDRIPIHHIPHPSCIDLIHNLCKPYEMRSDEIAAIIHRYDNNWLAPFLVIKDLPWNTHCVLLDPSIQIHLYAYFKHFKEGFDFVPYLDWVSRKKVVLDSYHKLHTYGRTAVDNASLMLPTVGTDWIWAQKFLWPELTVQCGDTWGQKKIIEKLFNDKAFYVDCAEYAKEKVEFFSYEQRKQELLNKLYN